MQTFILDFDFNVSAGYLDSRRLNKQLIECTQIQAAIQGESNGWFNHPCVTMWKNETQSFLFYSACVAKECKMRNINNKLIDNFNATTPVLPSWLTEDFINRHRSALLFKTAVKFLVYDYSLFIKQTLSSIRVNGSLNKHIWDTKSLVKYQDLYTHYKDKQLFKTKRHASVTEVVSAKRDYDRYVELFGNLPHRIDYIW